MRKVGLIIGESFNPSDYGCFHTWDHAFVSLKASGKMILTWFELSHEEMWRRFDSMNVVNRSGVKISKDMLSEKLFEYPIVVIIGKIAEEYVLGAVAKVPYQFKRTPVHTVYVLPHPSGRNRLLNKAHMRNSVKLICKNILRHMESVRNEKDGSSGSSCCS